MRLGAVDAREKVHEILFLSPYQVEIHTSSTIGLIIYYWSSTVFFAARRCSTGIFEGGNAPKPLFTMLLDLSLAQRPKENREVSQAFAPIGKVY